MWAKSAVKQMTTIYKKRGNTMPKQTEPQVSAAPVNRYQPDCRQGLATAEVEARTAAGMRNTQEDNLTPTISQIIIRNTVTLFNIINAFLAICVIAVGHPENALFFGVVICNSAMGIFQEVRSKRTLDKLSILAQAKASVVRDGKITKITPDELVLDDIVYLKSGDQVCADGVVVQAKGLEADESMLTGETDRIRKPAKSQVLSGSFITGGQAYIQVTAVGEDNYANALTAEAKKTKKNKSRLLFLMNRIIQILTIVIIPLGLLLFYSQYISTDSIETSVLGAAAAVSGMIPSGLVLLTSVTLTVGAMTLARKKALVQSLPSIETLARTSVLCLDKTGTITDGSLAFERLDLINAAAGGNIETAIAEMMGALQDSNATAEALKKQFPPVHTWTTLRELPFNSDRKWSGATFQSQGTYILGAPNIIFAGREEASLRRANELAGKGYRFLCLAHSEEPLQDEQLPSRLRCEALLLLSDNIRSDAVETFEYFAGEGVILKVISGDNPRTVSTIAGKAGIAGAGQYIDMSQVEEDADFAELADSYTVFGHVSPVQKKKLIQGLQKKGHTACMTGDGVNDIPAMKEADCSVAMVSGSDAARSSCDFVLMGSDFGAMVNVLKEGRRVINNIEKVACIYLISTIYSVLFSLIYTFIPFPYPYAPLQMTAINTLTVGVPAFILALQPNYKRPEGRFLTNILEHSIPAAITILFNTLYIQLAGAWFDIPAEETSTMVVLLVGVVCFFLLLRITKPYTVLDRIMLGTLMAAFVILFVFLGDYFMYEGLFGRNVFFYAPLFYFSYHIHGFLGRISHAMVNWMMRRRQKK